MAEREKARVAVEQVHRNSSERIDGTLLQNRHQHVHGVGGFDLLIEVKDKCKEEKNDENRKPVLFMVCFRHAPNLLKPCPSASRRTGLSV